MLTTRCPHCSTTFRIRPEQLGVRGGRVRCGTCHTAFSALETLEELPDDLPPVPPAAPKPAVPATAFAAKPAVAPAQVVAAPVQPVPAFTPPVSPPVVAAVPPPPAPVVPPKVDVPAPAVAEAAEPPAAEAVVRKEPAAEPGWLKIDADLPQGGFQHVVEQSALRSVTQTNLDLPTIDDAPPLIDPAKLEPPVASKEALASFGMEFDLTGIPEDASRDKPKPDTRQHPSSVVPDEPYMSKVATELGVAPFDPSQDDNLGLTYMLDDSVDEPAKGPGKLAPTDETSLLYLRDQQEPVKKRAEVEDRRKKRRIWPWVLGILVLLLLATGQIVYLARGWLAVVVPESRLYLEQACRSLECLVPYPKDPSRITIEGSNLVAEASPEGYSRLIVTLRNKAPHAVAWPHLELTLTDKFDIAISRRVLKPIEWLPAPGAQKAAFDGNSEITANILLATGKPDPSGYRIYTFYP